MENNNGISKRMLLVGSLKDIRLSLSVKRIVSPKIKKADLKSIVDSAKSKLDDNILANEIDKVFEEYFVQKKETISLNNMEEMIRADKYNDEGQGISFAKRDNHFKSRPDSNEKAA